ncbi:MAG: EAL domain-containing protein [Cyanobium sp.]
MATYRNQADSFHNKLGTDVDQLRATIELILTSQPDQASRQRLLEPLLERHLMDDRFSCFRLRLAASELQIPPSRACAARKHHETIRLDLAGADPGSLSIAINHSQFDEQRADNLLMSAAVAAISLLSFGLIGANLLRAHSRLQRQLAESNLQTLLDASPVLMVELSAEGRILRASQPFQELCAERGLTIGSEISSVFERDACRQIMDMMGRCSLNPALPVSCDSTLSLLPDDHAPAQMGASLGINPMARELSYLLPMTNVTAVVEEKQRFEAMLRYDFLTGALSRRALEDAYADGTRDRDYGILMIDIDFFKSINDNFGHLIGDQYLQHAARLLQQTLGAQSPVFRLSGEEFLALYEANDQAAICEEAERICHQFISVGLEADGLEIKRTVSLGGTWLRRSDQLSQALQIADYGLSLAKESGRNKLRFVSRRDYLASERSRPSMEQVEAAINQAAIDLYLEPIVDTRTGHIDGFEALLRWPTAEGSIAPLRFLESYYYVTNRISSGRSRINLLNLVLQRLGFSGGERGAWVSYNIVLSDFDQTSLALFAAIDPEYRKGLILEVSEQLLASRVDEQMVARHLRELSDLGFRIALDDFGVNGSNLGRLSLFPVDVVKLDKCLIQGIAHSAINQSIVQSVCLLAQNLSIRVIAEGVETPIEAQMLQKLGIHLHQGYHYGRAVCAEEARHLAEQATGAASRTQAT